MEDYEVHEHDVVVIGAGGAGLRAAIEASATGASVAMICKSMSVSYTHLTLPTTPYV